MNKRDLKRRHCLLAGTALAAALPVTLGTGCTRLLQREPRWLAAPELAALAPAAPREFRAAWVATVANIDWPSRKGLSAPEQQAEIRQLLDVAVDLKLNAIILQVRTSADAFYESALEPWSEYLSGTQGQSPGYDPLALWIAEAHQRGLELHAWLNPFRARQSQASSAPSPKHLSQTQPSWVKRYGDQQWMDPGEPDAAAHTLAVCQDLLQRYAVDGLHIDDYFYPYPVNDPVSKQELDFPDEPSWQRYLQGAGQLTRADWRRQNVDQLVQRIHQTVRTTKPWVRFGISPFGLGKPSWRPPGITGFSQYDKLYADAERWLSAGWLDYFVPQLYWPIAQKPQAFGTLLDYWQAQNPLGRHLWPGLFTSRVLALSRSGNNKTESWPVTELLEQIALIRERREQRDQRSSNRQRTASSGHAHFSMVALSQNRRGLADALKVGPYAQAALVPATAWLEDHPALPLEVQISAQADGQLHLLLTARQRHAVWLRYGGERWVLHLLGQELRVPALGLDGVVVAAIDRIGREGPRLGYRLD
jgi:uncharacterized lipoprotein YddW (UPF0748 family)